jgi:hypothetical protein
MATKLVLGPSYDNYDEPAPAAPAAPDLVGVVFNSPPVAPGANVRLKIANVWAARNLWPVKVYAAFVPKGSETPLVQAADPQGFLNAGFPTGSLAIDASISEEVNFQVAGTAPGLYFVQTVLEYSV